MRSLYLVCLFSFCTIITNAQQENLAKNLESKKVLLPNGWTLTPAGRSLEVGDLPLNMAVSSTKKLMAVTNNGQGIQTVQLIDTKTEKVLDNIVIPKSFYGIKFSKDEKQLYVSGGNDNWIMQYVIINSKLIHYKLLNLIYKVFYKF